MVSYGEKEARTRKVKNGAAGSNEYCHLNKHVQSGLWILLCYWLNCSIHISKNKSLIWPGSDHYSLPPVNMYKILVLAAIPKNKAIYDRCVGYDLFQLFYHP